MEGLNGRAGSTSSISPMTYGQVENMWFENLHPQREFYWVENIIRGHGEDPYFARSIRKLQDQIRNFKALHASNYQW